MNTYHFFVRGDYDSLPAPLKLKVDKIGERLAEILASYDKQNNGLFSKKYLEVVKDLLLLALDNPLNFSREMIAAIGEIPSIENIELSPECENAIKDLMDAEIAKDLHLFLDSAIQKIKDAVGK